MRTVREELSVSDVIDAEQRLYPRLEDAYDALKWWLAHVPEGGEIVDDLNWIFRQNGNKNRNIPSLVVIYTFDHQYVTIKFILVRIPSVQ